MRPTERIEFRTQQQVFDHVWNHFVVEENPKSLSRGSCCYGGTGCAVGCCVCEDDLRLAKEDFLVTALPSLVSKVFPGVHSMFLQQLQTLHDCEFGDDLTENRKELEKFAEEYELKIPEGV